MDGTMTTRRVAVLVAPCSSFLTPFMGSSLNIALPSIGREFSISALVLGWISTAYLLASAMFLVPFGKLADLRGRKRIFSSPNTNAVMSSVDRSHYGVASATLATMRLTGQMLSMGIVMLIFALLMGGIGVTPEAAPRFLARARVAFSVFAALCLLGVFASLARGNIRANGHPLPQAPVPHLSIRRKR